MYVPYNLGVPQPAGFPRESSPCVHKRPAKGYSLSLVIIVKNWMQDKCPPEEWINKMWHTYVMKYFTGVKSQEPYLFQQ